MLHGHAGLAGDLLQQARVFHVFQKNSAYIFFANLLDDECHGTGRGLAVAVGAQRRNKCHVVARAQIGKGTVRGQHLALRSRNRRKLLLGPAMQLLQFALVGRQALLVMGAACRVGRNQGVGDVAGIGLHAHGVLPDVRILLAVCMFFMVMTVVVTICVGQRCNALGGNGHRDFAVLHGALQRGAFQPQAIDQQQLGGADFAHVGRGHLVAVGIGVGRNQGLHGHALAANVLGHVGQDAEAGDYRQGRVGPGAAQAEQTRQNEGFEEE